MLLFYQIPSTYCYNKVIKPGSRPITEVKQHRVGLSSRMDDRCIKSWFISVYTKTPGIVHNVVSRLIPIQVLQSRIS
jgi:hypothetical protein